MINLSVNINKVATIRNARGGEIPDVRQVALDCETFGAQGITVHPRPDGRHIRYSDVFDIKPVIKTEFNIEGFPSDEFIDMVIKARPTQVTLVPDAPEALTSSAGWDVESNAARLSEIVETFKDKSIRTSLFLETDLHNIEAAAKTGADRIELYTGPYAEQYISDREAAIKPYIAAAEHAKHLGLGVNAGHDLTLGNLEFFATRMPFLDEVSIGHALICDALYYGLEATIAKYLLCLK
ncbi:MAG: pyridoxine 5'-phosphate synthase [Tannerella sp.]|jgi:pyridoxine 5-phosphate synthase|nr:pyridoxine 5'-phosphate synthase [Tannerella sp.]